MSKQAWMFHESLRRRPRKSFSSILIKEDDGLKGLVLATLEGDNLALDILDDYLAERHAGRDDARLLGGRLRMARDAADSYRDGKYPGLRPAGFRFLMATHADPATMDLVIGTHPELVDRLATALAWDWAPINIDGWHGRLALFVRRPDESA